MILSQILGLLAGLTALLAYGFYFRQMAKGESTPNPSSWLIFFIAGVINTFTYLTVVKGNVWQTLFIIVITICLFGVLVYSLFKGRFTKVKRLEVVIFLLAVGIGIFWQISDNARLANLLLQGIYVIAYLPTFVGLIRGTAKENYVSWLNAVISYTFATLALFADYPEDWIAFVSPVVNGILGNGIVVMLILIFQGKTKARLLAKNMEEYQKNRPHKKIFQEAKIVGLRNQAIDKIKSKLLPDEKIIKILLIGSSIKGSFGQYEPPGFRGSLFSDFDFIVFVENDYEIPSWLDKEPDGKPFLNGDLNLAYRKKKFIEGQYDVEVFFLRHDHFENPAIQEQGELAGIPMTTGTTHRNVVVYNNS